MEFAQASLQKRLESLLSELASLKSRTTEEAVHDTRVQSRRMRSALEAFEDLLPPRPYKAVYESVRRITKTLGRPREQGVSLALLRELTLGGDMAENLCREYLEERFAREMRKQGQRLEKGLKAIDGRSLRSQVEFLLAAMEPQELWEAPRVRRRSAARAASAQLALFPPHSQPAERGLRIVAQLAMPVLSFRAPQQFRRASDDRLHGLRIAAKKLRYGLEIFEPVLPKGFQPCIGQAKALQDAAGIYHDWCVLNEQLKEEIRRLNRRGTVHLAFQIGRLLAHASDIKKNLRKRILPELTGLQAMLAPLLSVPSKTTPEPVQEPSAAQG